jgi:phospholipase C
MSERVPGEELPAASLHPGWSDLIQQIQHHVLTRRQFFPGAAAMLGGLALGSTHAAQALGLSASVSASLSASVALPDLATWHANTPIKHVVILCQENRSFDHYFGAFASQLGSGNDTALGFDPAQLSYPDGSGNFDHPYHLTQFCNEDPDHSWEGSHAKWNNGAMDGWVTAEDGSTTAIGYFEPADHIYHVALAKAFAIADHYFCAQIGPTLPNRLYLWTGTSGWDFLTPSATSSGLPFNNPSLTAPPPVLTWPTMADVLSRAGVPWKNYSVADGSVPSTIGAFNPLIFFSQVLTNPVKLARATADFSEFIADLAAGTLPAVSWIVTEAVVSEHPPAPPDMGQLLASRVVQALMNSSAWGSTALFITYDEGGGFFEHVAPRILESVPANLPAAGTAIGPGFRVPLFIVSPWARAGSVFKERLDHTSILQFIERNFSTASQPLQLPTIAKGRRSLADLTRAFDFDQVPLYPTMPAPWQLYPDAQRTILTLNLARTAASCSTTAPSWLPGLLGV